MNLSDVFSAVAYKQLAAVDLPHAVSNQHELNGSGPLRDFFGTSGLSRGTIQWHYFSDGQDPLSESGDWTFYDARARSAGRTGRMEWRFYYTGRFLALAAPGDEVVLARTTDGTLYGLV